MIYEKTTLIIIILACMFFGWRLIASPAPVGLVIALCIILGALALVCIDALIAISGPKGGRQ